MKYTCAEYRQEMLLLSLRKQLTRDGLTEEEKQKITEELNKLESQIEMD